MAQILGDIRISPPMRRSILPVLGRLAQLSGADTVMWGQFVKFGNRNPDRRDGAGRQAPADDPVEGAGRDGARSWARLSVLVRQYGKIWRCDAAVKELVVTSFKPSTAVSRPPDYYEGVRWFGRAASSRP